MVFAVLIIFLPDFHLLIFESKAFEAPQLVLIFFLVSIQSILS